MGAAFKVHYSLEILATFVHQAVFIMFLNQHTLGEVQHQPLLH